MTTEATTEPLSSERRPHPDDGPAARALAEAAARRRARDAAAVSRPPEVQGRPGPEPVRYGDWENKGIACDF